METMKKLTLSVHPNLEEQVLISHSKLLEKEIEEHLCCSCEHLLKRKSVTVKLSDDLNNVVPPRLTGFILEQTPDAQEYNNVILYYV